MYKLKSSDRTKLENHIYFYLREKLDLLEDAELEALSPEALLEGEVFSPDPGAAWWVDDPAEGRALFLHMAGQALQDEREAREQGTLELD
ncbi:MAG: hypothetical protein KatS3mg071_1593 [Meiothermus sp.]|nr:MAG: hypothetical protein KatS3mg071_1593 [Meiothermus sp.]